MEDGEAVGVGVGVGEGVGVDDGVGCGCRLFGKPLKSINAVVATTTIIIAITATKSLVFNYIPKSVDYCL